MATQKRSSDCSVGAPAAKRSAESRGTDPDGDLSPPSSPRERSPSPERVRCGFCGQALSPSEYETNSKRLTYKSGRCKVCNMTWPASPLTNTEESNRPSSSIKPQIPELICRLNQKRYRLMSWESEDKNSRDWLRVETLVNNHEARRRELRGDLELSDIEWVMANPYGVPQQVQQPPEVQFPPAVPEIPDITLEIGVGQESDDTDIYSFDNIVNAETAAQSVDHHPSHSSVTDNDEDDLWLLTFSQP